MDTLKITEQIITNMSELLFIAADETRLKILCTLLDGSKNVSEIVAATDASQSLVSHQLKVLRNANLVSTRKEGNFVYYSLTDDHVEKLINVAYEHVTEE